MIVRDTTGACYKVRETGSPDLAHVWYGIPYKIAKGRWQPRTKATEQLVRKAGCIVVAMTTAEHEGAR